MARTRPLVLDPRSDDALDSWSDGEDSQLDALGAVQQASSPRPATAWEALMQCAPGEEPDTAQDDLYPLREIIQDCIEFLTEREQYIFNAIVVERLSYRALSQRMNLSKSQVHRIQLANIQQLRSMLLAHESIRQYLGGS